MDKRPDKTRDKTGGFSLIEVLVAFVILSLVVTACLQVYSTSARAEAAARWSEEAHALLHDRLGSLETLKLQPGQQTSGAAGDGFRWTVDIAMPVIAGGQPNGRSVVWVTAQVTAPTGQVYSATTARWRGEAFAAPIQIGDEQ